MNQSNTPDCEPEDLSGPRQDFIRSIYEMTDKEDRSNSEANDWMDEARMIAAQCWCDDETKDRVMDPPLAESVARRIAAWMRTGAMHAQNEAYWRERAEKAESLPSEKCDARLEGECAIRCRRCIVWGETCRYAAETTAPSDKHDLATYLRGEATEQSGDRVCVNLTRDDVARILSLLPSETKRSGCKWPNCSCPGRWDCEQPNAAPQSEGTRDAGLPEAGRIAPADAATSPGRPAAALLPVTDDKPETPRVNAVAPVDAFVTDSDQWAVSKTDYDCLLDVAIQLERELAVEKAQHVANVGHMHDKLMEALACAQSAEQRIEGQTIEQWAERAKISEQNLEDSVALHQQTQRMLTETITPSHVAPTEDVEMMKKVIAWANNSLYGSHGFFLSDRGGPADEHHLDFPIEKLKAYGNEQWRRAEKAEAELKSLRSAIRQIDKQVTIQASEHRELLYDAGRYRWLRDNMRRMPLGENGQRYFFDQPGTMSFQEAVDEAAVHPTDSGVKK